LVYGTKNDNLRVPSVGEAIEPLPLPLGLVLEEDIPKDMPARSTLFATTSSFFLSFASIASYATHIISELDLLQIPTSCPQILARRYFNWETPLVILDPHNLQLRFFRFVPPLGFPYYQNGSKGFGIFVVEVFNGQLQNSVLG